MVSMGALTTIIFLFPFVNFITLVFDRCGPVAMLCDQTLSNKDIPLVPSPTQHSLHRLLRLTFFLRKPAFSSPLDTLSTLVAQLNLCFLTLLSISKAINKQPDMFAAQLWRRLLTLVVLAYYARAQQTIIYDQAHNYTSIVGTWSSGSMNVQTGPVRCSPDLFGAIFNQETTPSCRDLPTQQICHLHTPRLQAYLILCEPAASFLALVEGLTSLVISTEDMFYEVARYRFQSNGSLSWFVFWFFFFAQFSTL
jgi:hypothetical protein